MTEDEKDLEITKQARIQWEFNKHQQKLINDDVLTFNFLRGFQKFRDIPEHHFADMKMPPSTFHNYPMNLDKSIQSQLKNVNNSSKVATRDVVVSSNPQKE